MDLAVKQQRDAAFVAKLSIPPPQTQGAVWARQRRLKKLAEAAEQTPNDPAVIAAYVVELAAADPKGVVRFVEGGQAAVDSVVAVEYVKVWVGVGGCWRGGDGEAYCLHCKYKHMCSLEVNKHTFCIHLLVLPAPTPSIRHIPHASLTHAPTPGIGEIRGS